MGSAATEEMARRGYRVIMACRNLEKAGRVRAGILSRVPGARLDIEELHLDSFASIRDFGSMRSSTTQVSCRDIIRLPSRATNRPSG